MAGAGFYLPETPVVNVWHVLSVSSVVHLFEAQTGKPVGNGKPIQHTVSGIMLQQNASPCKNMCYSALVYMQSLYGLYVKNYFS